MTFHPGDEDADVVAHQIKLVHVVTLGWVHRDFRRRQTEDEPSATLVDVS